MPGPASDLGLLVRQLLNGDMTAARPLLDYLQEVHPLEGIRLESQGGFLSGELLIKLRQRGRTIAEVGVPHYPRIAGQQSGANPRVVFRAIRDFWRLRLRLWFRRSRALQFGEPVLGDQSAA